MFDTLTTSIESMVTSADAGRVLIEIERAARQLEAVKVAAVARIRRDDLHKCDGHIRLSGWLRTVVNMPSAEANRLERLAALVTAHPQVGRRLSDGTLGVAQAHRLAAAHSNRRVAWSFPSFVDLLVDNAMRLPFDDFSQVIDHWQRLADADGAHRHAEMVHDGRDATIHTLGDTTFVDAHMGTLHGTLVTEVFEHFLRRELDRDIAERDSHGPRPGADLPRTPSQRRADALVAVFTAAAGHHEPVAVWPQKTGGSSPAPCSHTASSHQHHLPISRATRDVFEHGPAAPPDPPAGCAGSSSRRR